MESVKSRANFVFGPSPNSARKRPEIASHAGHFAARHVLEETPQRLDTSLVRGDHAQRPHLHCCHHHLAFSPSVPVWRSTRASPTSFTRLTRSLASLLALCSPWQSTAMDGRAAQAAAAPLLPAARAKLVPGVVSCSPQASTLFLHGRKCPWPACSVLCSVCSLV